MSPVRIEVERLCGENSSESLVKKLLTTVRNWLLDSLEGVEFVTLSVSSSEESRSPT